MDVHSRAMAELSRRFKHKLELNNTFSECIHVSLVKLDLETKLLRTISTQYDWHLSYWDEDLQEEIGKRMKVGFNIWNEISPLHSKVLSKNSCAKAKIDICSQSGNIFEIFSLGVAGPISVNSLAKLAREKPQVSTFFDELAPI